MGSDSKSKGCSGAERISTWEEPGIVSDVLVFVENLKRMLRKQKSCDCENGLDYSCGGDFREVDNPYRLQGDEKLDISPPPPAPLGAGLLDERKEACNAVRGGTVTRWIQAALGEGHLVASTDADRRVWRRQARK